MRKGRIMTLRGQLNNPDEPVHMKRQLILDDGRLTIGYKVLSFEVWPMTYDVNTSYHATLSTDVSSDLELNASDNRQIAWVLFNTYQSTFAGMIDPDHIVNRNLFIRIKRGQDYLNYNYLIVMEEVLLSDDESIMTIIKNEAQDIADD